MKIKDITSFIGLTRKKEEPVMYVDEAKKKDPSIYGEKVIEHSWTAPTRIIQEMSPKSARTVIVMAVSVSLLFALMQEFIIIIVIASAGFLYYMLSQSPATQVTHEVSTHGLLYGGEQFYYWYELKQFFFKGDGKGLLLCVDTVEKLPGRIYLNIDPADREKLKSIFSKRLLFLEEEPKGFIDKMYGSAISKFSLDK